MKVLLINGSPHQKGCTYTALKETADSLNKNGIETEIFWIGNKAVNGCTACGSCYKTKKCVFEDGVNEILSKMDDYEGLIVGTPVYYAGPNGSLCAFLDRLFYCARGRMTNKFAAAVASCRRSGITSSLDRLIKYFTISKMHVVSSQYWNGVHGNTPEEVLQDEEGLQTMRVLGENMAWLIKAKQASKESGVPMPQYEKRVSTNFIR